MHLLYIRLHKSSCDGRKNKSKTTQQMPQIKVLLARNLILNSEAAPKYKYMLGPNRGPPTNLYNTVNQT